MTYILSEEDRRKLEEAMKIGRYYAAARARQLDVAGIDAALSLLAGLPELTAFADRIRQDEREAAALRMEMALDHLQFMAQCSGVREDCREGYKGAHDVIAPMFADFVPCASAIRSRKP